MPPDDAPAPTSGLRFGVEIQGLVVGWFTECTSLSVERAVIPYQEGGANDRTLQLPGQVSYTKVTLKDGLAGNVLWDWFQGGQYDGSIERRNVTVVVYDAAGDEAARWDLLECLPLKWVGPAYSAGAAQIAVQEIQIGRGEGSAQTTAVQRAQAGEGAVLVQPQPSAGSIDLPALALKVYDLLRQDLRLERERLGQRRM